jgi:hypothetical protein
MSVNENYTNRMIGQNLLLWAGCMCVNVCWNREYLALVTKIIVRRSLRGCSEKYVLVTFEEVTPIFPSLFWNIV